jgi:sulfite reductase (NADPH) flavoprotein alpha-component
MQDMLPETRLKQLQEFIREFSKEELIWINGYLAGLVANGHSNGSLKGSTALLKDEKGAAKTITKRINLVYGTETGNAKKLASSLAAIAKKRGVNLKLTGLDQYRFTDLVKEEYFFVVISTQGEGEPPIPAKKFYDQLHQESLSLEHMKYGVLGLGDTAYPLFCKTGEDVDARLEQLGANRLVPLIKCDTDYEADAENWFSQVLDVLEKESSPSSLIAPLQPTPMFVSSQTSPQVTEKKSTGKKYYSGKIIVNINLNDKGSFKQTNHIEIGTADAVEYEPGDSIAIVPANKKEVVKKILRLAGIDPSTEIQTSKITATAEDQLTKYLNICYLLTSTIRKYATITQQEIPDTRMDLVDLLRIYPVKETAQFVEVIKILTPIAPRLYSISSSPSAHEGELHITVGRNSFYAQNEQRFGLCSEFLGDQPLGTPITFYIHKNRAFKLPEPERDIIMIGPGTGIAPMRSFMAERDITGASGKNWLFFGEQHFTTDFLYQTEIQNYLQTGLLANVSLAFSRDHQYKIYVQHRMAEQGNELYNWLQSGAYLFISGSKEPMSVDVENTLVRIIEQHGNKSSVEAKAYWEELKKEGRYQRDVY